MQQNLIMTSDLLIIDMVNEVKSKFILHWNYRGLTEIPEEIRNVGSHVEEIYLKWNNLSTLPKWIPDFHNVTNLYLHGNNITSVPNELGYMEKLTVLDLSANKLSEIPPCIGNLRTLRSLLLNKNFIKFLPLDLSKLINLEYLCLSGNQLIALPEWLGRLSKLTELSVDNNNLEELPNSLTVAPSLQMISVCSNRLKYLPLAGFLSDPYVYFDSNPYLNYLSLPLLLQLTSKIRYNPRNSINSIANGCFRSTDEILDGNLHIHLQLVPQNTSLSNKYLNILLPRQLITIHTVKENKPASLGELSLRKLYCNKFCHLLKISFQPPEAKLTFGSNSIIKGEKPLERQCLKHFLPYHLLDNCPVSICTNELCNQPIFTEGWIIFGMGRDDLIIPTLVIFCSHKCAKHFIRITSFDETNELYHIVK